MKSYVLKRILTAPLLLIFVSFAVFSLSRLSPSDPAEVALRVNDVTITPEVVESMREELGLNKPFMRGYFSWIKDIASGDFGRSYVTRAPVMDELLHALPVTLGLAALSLMQILFFSLSVGIFCALKENSIADIIARFFIFLLSAVPSFWLGLMLILIFSFKLNLFDTSGFNGIKSLILPSVTLSAAYIGTYARMLRNTMVAVKKEPFIIYAKARGLSANLINVHVVKNALKPCLIALGMSLPKLVAGTFVIESVFGLGGVGKVCLQAIFSRDFPMIQAYVLLLACMFIVFNLLADISVRYLDPRLTR